MKLEMKMDASEHGSDAHIDCARKTKRFYAENAKWVTSSNACINMKLVQTEDQLFDEDGYFHPVYTNQVSGRHS